MLSRPKSKDTFPSKKLFKVTRENDQFCDFSQKIWHRIVSTDNCAPLNYDCPVGSRSFGAIKLIENRTFCLFSSHSNKPLFHSLNSLDSMQIFPPGHHRTFCRNNKPNSFRLKLNWKISLKGGFVTLNFRDIIGRRKKYPTVMAVVCIVVSEIDSI